MKIQFLGSGSCNFYAFIATHSTSKDLIFKWDDTELVNPSFTMFKAMFDDIQSLDGTSDDSTKEQLFKDCFINIIIQPNWKTSVLADERSKFMLMLPRGARVVDYTPYLDKLYEKYNDIPLDEKIKLLYQWVLQLRADFR